MKLQRIVLASLCSAALMGATAARAAEYYVGEPVIKNNMQIVPNYLLGIAMDPMPKGMAMDKDAIHLEVDIHATKGETHGFAEDQWIPYVTVQYTLQKEGSDKKITGELYPMVAADGSHYANNVKMDGDGTYKLTYHFLPPSAQGFARHTDKATGVPAWWKPFDASWTFQYPSKAKAE